MAAGAAPASGRGSGEEPAPAAAPLRLATSRDLDRLAALWGVLHGHHAAADPGFERRPGAEAVVRELLARQLQDTDAAIFVWEEAGELAGFCSVRIDRAPPILVETERAEIGELLVRESHRRRGIGRALVSAASGWARRRGVARLEVRVAARNPEGQAFWRALGYRDLMDVLHRRL